MSSDFESKYRGEDVVADYLNITAEQRMIEAERDHVDVVEHRRQVENRTRRSGLNMFRSGNGSPNPGGRPKTKLISGAARRVLAQLDPNDPANRTFAEQMVTAMVREAMNGNVQAFKELREMTEGKIPDKVEVGQPGEFDLDHLWADATDEELNAIVAEHLERTLARRSEEDSDGRGRGSSGDVSDRLVGAQSSSSE